MKHQHRNPKTPIQEEMITVTVEMLNEMVASVVATYLKTVEAEKRKSTGSKGKHVTVVGEEQGETRAEQQKEKERVNTLLE